MNTVKKSKVVLVREIFSPLTTCMKSYTSQVSEVVKYRYKDFAVKGNQSVFFRIYSSKQLKTN